MDRLVEERFSNILLVERDLAEARRVRELLAESRFESALYRVDDWNEGLAFIRGVAPFHGVPVPDLVLLDLDQPHGAPENALTELRAYPGFESLPVVVLTSAAGSLPIAVTGALQVVEKPLGYAELLSALRSLVRRPG